MDGVSSQPRRAAAEPARSRRRRPTPAVAQRIVIPAEAGIQEGQWYFRVPAWHVSQA